jgi:hypothetical protein
MKSYWTGVASAFGLGTVVGGLVVRVLLEKKMRDNPVEKIVFYQTNINGEAPVETEDELVEQIDFNEETHIVEPIIINNTAEYVKNDYHKAVEEEGGKFVDLGETSGNDYLRAVAAVETPIDLFVDGGVNNYGVSYIEEEDFLEEDGRYKGHIDIIMDEYNPVFLMDGQQIDDWDKKVGDSILVDFFTKVPPGADDVLYVRNHRTEEDYEVVRVNP